MIALDRAKPATPPSRKSSAACIAYLSAQKNLLHVSRKYRADIFRKWNVEKDADRGWFIPRRQLSVSVHEVSGFVGATLMDDREGDERIRKGCKCTGKHAAVDTKCSADSLWSAELMGYSDCERADPGDTCDEIYVKIGYTHDWKYLCTEKYSDLPVFRWVCLP